MSRLPRLDGEDLIRALLKAGFERVGQRGSHVVMKHPYGRTTVVPAHNGETLGPGIVSNILRDADLSRAGLISLL